jgi:hypothetical protein
LLEKISRNPEEKLKNIIVRQRKEDVIEEDTMEEEVFFPKGRGRGRGRGG